MTTGIGKTGVVGVLKNGPGPTLWYRADMDANGGVRETTGLPWAAMKPQTLADGSEVDVMHACGHDAHITWLLGAASRMTKLKSEWSGTLVVYAQPAEEVGLGAKAMVDDGLWTRGLPKPDFALGSHTAPAAVGMVSNTAGVRMAGVDQLDVDVPGCRRPRLGAGDGDRPGRHGGTSRARLPDDRQPDDRSADTGRAHGRGDPGGP